MVQSANDAAYALAEHIGGTASGFVEIMNEDAKS
jgi:D-alanyl-D-alanine carboxypeptidase